MDRRIGVKGSESEGKIDAVGDVLHDFAVGFALHDHISDIKALGNDRCIESRGLAGLP